MFCCGPCPGGNVPTAAAPPGTARARRGAPGTPPSSWVRRRTWLRSPRRPLTRAWTCRGRRAVGVPVGVAGAAALCWTGVAAAPARGGLAGQAQAVRRLRHDNKNWWTTVFGFAPGLTAAIPPRARRAPPEVRSARSHRPAFRAMADGPPVLRDEAKPVTAARSHSALDVLRLFHGPPCPGGTVRAAAAPPEARAPRGAPGTHRGSWA